MRRLVTSAIIAGGHSTRMATDKRALLVEGVPMLTRVIAAVSAVSDDVLVACATGNSPDASLLLGTGARLVYDRIEDGGPLAGVDAVLGATARELVLVVAADMPWLAPGVLRMLIEKASSQPAAEAVALATERGPEPLLAVYRAGPARLVVGRLLESGVRRMHALLDELELETIEPKAWAIADPAGRTALNVNRREDLVGALETPNLRSSAQEALDVAPREGSRARRAG